MTVKIMRLIGSLLQNDADGGTGAGRSRIRAGLRLFLVLMIIVLCSLSRNAVFTAMMLMISLLELSFMRPTRIRAVLKRVPLPVLTAMAVCLPAVFMGHPGTMLTVSMKVLECVLLLGMLGEQYSWKELTEVPGALHVPGIVILTLDMTVRFLVILGRISSRLSEAVILRSTAEKSRHWRKSAAAAGGVLGTTFLLSRRMAQETGEAMELRGFSGEYRRRRQKERLTAAEWGILLLVPALIVFYCVCERAVR